MNTNGFEMIKASEMTKEQVNPNIYYINYFYKGNEYYTPMSSTYKYGDNFEFPEEMRDEVSLRFLKPYKHGEDILKILYVEEESEKKYFLEEMERVQRLKEERLQREGLFPMTKEKIVAKKTSLLLYLKHLTVEDKILYGMFTAYFLVILLCFIACLFS